jgi:hypothetical protein
MAQFPWATPKTYFLGLFADEDWTEISDPFSMNPKDTRICYERLAQSLDRLVDRVLREETIRAECIEPAQRKAQNERYFGARF